MSKEEVKIWINKLSNNTSQKSLKKNLKVIINEDKNLLNRLAK